MGCTNSKKGAAQAPQPAGYAPAAAQESEPAATPSPEVVPAPAPAPVAKPAETPKPTPVQAASKKEPELIGHASASHKEEDNDQTKGLLAESNAKSNDVLSEVSSNTKRKLNRTKSDNLRMIDFIQGLKDLPDDSPIKRGFRCFCKYGVKPLILVFMFYVWLGKKIYCIYKMLPMNVIQCIFGVVLCFFGGTYFATFAAVEAAINLGGEDLWKHLNTLYVEGSKIGEASLEDDKVDANKNDIADVDEMNCNDLINHKAKVAMVAVKDPEEFQGALVCLANIWIAVLATLKFEFARTVMIAMGIANMLIPMATKILAPPLASLLGKDLCHWAPTMIDTLIKIIAVSLASFIQSVISAYYSALRGGKLFAVALLNIATERGLMDKVPDFLADKPFDPDRSYLDEGIMYPLAAAGFYMQMINGFQLILGFPFSLILLPVTTFEWILRWEIYT